MRHLIIPCLLASFTIPTTAAAADSSLMEQASMQAAIQSRWFYQQLGRVSIDKTGNTACVEEIKSTDPNVPKSVFFDVKKGAAGVPLIVTPRSNPC